MCDTVFNYERNYDCHKQICCGLNMYRCETCGKMYQSKKSLCGHRRKHHTDDVCHFTFFVENVTYINFLHILYTCGMKIFNYVHAMGLYYRGRK